MPDITKRALADSLKKLLAVKPLDKLTVSDLAADCGINRQTFYYHFRDLYDLIDWTYENDAAACIGANRTYNTWQRGLLGVFGYILQNRAFVLATCREPTRQHLIGFLYKQVYQLLYNVANEAAAGLDVSYADKAFVAHFYKYGFVGLVLDWIDRGMTDSPALLVEKLSVVMEGNLPGALARLRRETAAPPPGGAPPPEQSKK